MTITDMTVIMIKDYDKYDSGNYYTVKKAFGRFLISKGYAIDRFSPNFEKQMADIRRAEEREREIERKKREAEKRKREIEDRRKRTIDGIEKYKKYNITLHDGPGPAIIKAEDIVNEFYKSFPEVKEAGVQIEISKSCYDLLEIEYGKARMTIKGLDHPFYIQFLDDKKLMSQD